MKNTIKTVAADLFRRTGHLLAWSELVWCIAQERRILRGLSREQFVDIGVDPVDAQREADSGAFEIPDNRLRKANRATIILPMRNSGNQRESGT